MITRLIQLTSAGLLALTLGSSTASAQPSFPFDVPPVPSALEVPDGHDVFFKGHAFGTQNYVCLPAATGVAWRFVAPQATLFLTFKGEATLQLTTHFLSPNPAESGLSRATWQHSFDSSQVWGRVSAASADPAFVEAGAIPWLLLDVVGAQRGPTGGSALARAAFIHRLNTSGGVAPETGCSVVPDIGSVALVPYEADYFFYRPTRHAKH